MIIKNASVFLPQGRFENKDICIEKDRIEEIPSERTVIDGSGCFLIPGLIDIHFHGCNGYDFCDATEESLLMIGSYELRHGITSICPATMTLPEDTLLAVCRNAYCYHYNWVPGKTAHLSGINLEGPFLSPAKKGAQNEMYLKLPDTALFQRLFQASQGLVKLITIAPELPGATGFIREAKQQARISLGHTCCDYETAYYAFLSGASHLTHLFNAMPPFSHRNPGPIGAAMDTGFVTAELICDGVHIAPAALRGAFALFGENRIIFISDSIRATGMTDGSYQLGGLDVSVQKPYATLADGTLAGSVTNLFDCLKTAVLSVGIPLETAINCATLNPAKVLGIDKDYGSIETGKFADLLLVKKNTLELQTVISHGEIIQVIH